MQHMLQSDPENPFLISKAPDSKDPSHPAACLTSQALLYNWVQGVPGFVITQGLPRVLWLELLKSSSQRKKTLGTRERRGRERRLQERGSWWHMGRQMAANHSAESETLGDCPKISNDRTRILTP